MVFLLITILVFFFILKLCWPKYYWNIWLSEIVLNCSTTCKLLGYICLEMSGHWARNSIFCIYFWIARKKHRLQLQICLCARKISRIHLVGRSKAFLGNWLNFLWIQVGNLELMCKFVVGERSNLEDSTLSKAIILEIKRKKERPLH